MNDCGSIWAKLCNEHELQAEDHGLKLMQQLKCVDGPPVYQGDLAGVTHWLIPLRPEVA
jgi:hypothetical protein